MLFCVFCMGCSCDQAARCNSGHIRLLGCLAVMCSNFKEYYGNVELVEYSPYAWNISESEKLTKSSRYMES